jgi:hypothetical protein
LLIKPPTQNYHFAPDLRGTAGLSGSGYNLKIAGDLGSAPYSVTQEAISEAREAEDEFYEELVRRFREEGVYREPGVIHHDEEMSLEHIAGGVNSRKRNFINEDGEVEQFTDENSQDWGTDLFIVVYGVKVALEVLGKPPAAPNPHVIWNANEEARETTTTEADTDKKVLTMSSYVIHDKMVSRTKHRSKLGQKDVYTVKWIYIVRLHPAIAEKLITNANAPQAKGKEPVPILQGITWPQAHDGIKDNLTQLLRQGDWKEK